MTFRMAALTLSLILTLSGCSGYRTACTSLSDLAPDRNLEFSSSCELAPGDDVRINLRDGRRLEGSLIEVSFTGILVSTDVDSLPPLQLSPDQVRSIEKKAGYSMGSALGVVVVGGLALATYVGFSNMSMF